MKNDVQSLNFAFLARTLAMLVVLIGMVGFIPTGSAAGFNFKDILKVNRTDGKPADKNDRIIVLLADNKLSELSKLKWEDIESLPPTLAQKVLLARAGSSKDRAIEDCKTALRSESNQSRFLLYAVAFRHPALGTQLAKLSDGYSAVKSAIFSSPAEKAVFLSLTSTGNLPAGDNPRSRPLVLQRNAVLYELRESKPKDSTVNALIKETADVVSTMNLNGVFSPIVPRGSVADISTTANADNFSAALVLAVKPYFDSPVEDLKLLFQSETTKTR